MSNIALVTCQDYPQLDGESYLVEAFASHGHAAKIEVWSDQDVNWQSYEYVIIRICYDYFESVEKRKSFLQWIDTTKAKTTILNDPSLLKWNIHKSYLEELAQKGVQTPKLRILHSAASIASVKKDFAGKVVVKPAVGGSAKGVRMFDELDQFADKYIAELFAEGEAIVQEYVPEIHRGEISVVLFNNRISHAVLKVPMEGEYRVNWKYGGRPKPNDFLLMELEILDPYLYIEGYQDLAHGFVESFNAYTDPR